jgi:hypothetical protein
VSSQWEAVRVALGGVASGFTGGGLSFDAVAAALEQLQSIDADTEDLQDGLLAAYEDSQEGDDSAAMQTFLDVYGETVARDAALVGWEDDEDPDDWADDDDAERADDDDSGAGVGPGLDDGDDYRAEDDAERADDDDAQDDDAQDDDAQDDDDEPDDRQAPPTGKYEDEDEDEETGEGDRKKTTDPKLMQRLAERGYLRSGTEPGEMMHYVDAVNESVSKVADVQQSCRAVQDLDARFVVTDEYGSTVKVPGYVSDRGTVALLDYVNEAVSQGHLQDWIQVSASLTSPNE